jgi:transcription elongation factor GreA
MIVTYHSPFAQAMIGKEVDDNFTLEIEGKETKFTITAIEKVFAE